MGDVPIRPRFAPPVSPQSAGCAVHADQVGAFSTRQRSRTTPPSSRRISTPNAAPSASTEEARSRPSGPAHRQVSHPRATRPSTCREPRPAARRRHGHRGGCPARTGPSRTGPSRTGPSRAGRWRPRGRGPRGCPRTAHAGRCRGPPHVAARPSISPPQSRARASGPAPRTWMRSRRNLAGTGPRPRRDGGAAGMWTDRGRSTASTSTGARRWPGSVSPTARRISCWPRSPDLPAPSPGHAGLRGRGFAPPGLIDVPEPRHRSDARGGVRGPYPCRRRATTNSADRTGVAGRSPPVRFRAVRASRQTATVPSQTAFSFAS